MAYNSNITINKSYITVQSLIRIFKENMFAKKTPKNTEKGTEKKPFSSRYLLVQIQQRKHQMEV